MIAYTIQLSKWRWAAIFGIEVLDTTVKSGDKTFAPTWDMVNAVKSSEITEEQYTELYTELMRKGYKDNKERWLEVLKKDRVAFACYCPKDTFCHRHLLVDILGKCAAHHNIEFERGGETGR